MNRTWLWACLWVGVSAFLPTAFAQAGGPRGVAVGATGTVYGEPDRASFDAGVSVLGEDVARARAGVGERVSRLLAVLRAAGVAEADVRTLNVTIFPEQLYDNNGQPTRLRYRVANTVRVTVREVGRLGALLGMSVEAGANEVSNVVYAVADPSALERQARAQAMRAARAKAEQLARLGGAELGRLRRVREGGAPDGVTPLPLARAESLDASAAADVPVTGGQLEVTVAVYVIYDLK